MPRIEVTAKPYVINKNMVKRFDQRDTVFGRMRLDRSAGFYRRGIYDGVRARLSRGLPEFDRFELTREIAAWTVYDYFHGAFSGRKLTGANSVMKKPVLPKVPVGDREGMTRELKKTAREFGAGAVGICRINRDWVYSRDLEGRPVRIPERLRYAVVVAITMDHEKIKTSPSLTAAVETGLGYSRTAFCISSLAEFIRYLGYDALGMGNDTALSIPLAIDAGLGELGRNGLLITPAYGSCVRLGKIFTDLPLTADRPVRFGAAEFCRRCRRCVNACRARAIQSATEPSLARASKSNGTGVLKWAVDHDRCYEFWLANGADCSNCIAACPFTDPGRIREY